MPNADPSSAESQLSLARQLYRAGRHLEGERVTAKATADHPHEAELWNLRGVFLRQLRRHAEALDALERAIALQPDHLGAQANRGNVLLDLGRAELAEAAFAALVARVPDTAAFRDGLARALLALGRREAALGQMREALARDPGAVRAWLQLAAALSESEGADAAVAALEEGTQLSPDNQALLEAKALVLRTSGQLRRAEAFLAGLLEPHPDRAWIHFHLGDLLAEQDRARGDRHLRRAVELDPDSLDHRIALIQSLVRASSGDEGGRLDEAAGLCREALARSGLGPAHAKVLRDVFARVCAFDDIDRLGTFQAIGRSWAQAGLIGGLLWQLPQVRTDADRLELLEQHRIWGRGAMARAARQPIVAPAPRARREKIRLGLMSSDLRRHPVGYFVEPLFDHLDAERFEVFCYASNLGREDDLQAEFARRSAGFRWLRDGSARDAAQAIAGDGLDMLIELGGATAMNKIEALAYAPAPLQASWLGYPHSIGLPTLDRLICDPFNAPPRPELLLETPMRMPRSWIVLGRSGFPETHALAKAPPEARNGFITFGTANNPNKYTRRALRAWAQVVAAIPRARFAFVRPEGASAAFRRNVLAEFAAAGVDESRVAFHAVRGAHMAFYNEIDISLDTFPLTGGTTTAEALWMGVPVVSLRGEAFFERLSCSILSNAGLGDLVADDLEAYGNIALRLVEDRALRTELRATLRGRIKASPLGDRPAFARDFYDLVASVVG